MFLTQAFSTSWANLYFENLHQICDKVNYQGWKVVRDEGRRMGPYAYSRNELVSFDDVDTMTQKSQMILDMRLGGAMVWALNLDDFGGLCGAGETYPLLRTINSVLGRSQLAAPLRTLETRDSNSITSYTGSPSSSSPMTPYNNQGNCLEGTTVRHPSSCGAFFRCVHGEVQAFQCPQGLFWNTEFNSCDWPSNVQCNAGAGSPLPSGPGAGLGGAGLVISEPDTVNNFLEQRPPALAAMPPSSTTPKPPATVENNNMKVVCCKLTFIFWTEKKIFALEKPC